MPITAWRRHIVPHGSNGICFAMGPLLEEALLPLKMWGDSGQRDWVVYVEAAFLLGGALAGMGMWIYALLCRS